MVDAISTTASSGTPAACANTSATAGSVPAPSATTVTQSQASVIVTKPVSITYLPLPGHLKGSDTDITEDLVELGTASRNYEANSTVISTVKDMMDTLLRIV